MSQKKRKNNIWNFVDSLEGDKVVWMIIILLILISIVAISSSTSLLALQLDTTRLKIMTDQLKISAIGVALILICYRWGKIGIYRVASQLGYAVSIFLLGILMSHKSVGPLQPLFINDAWRIISFKGMQIHVFEVVKVAMVMYLAWAVNAYKSDKFLIANLLGKRYSFCNSPFFKKTVYIYIPIITVCFGIMAGSLSSTIFIGGIMCLTILIGGIDFKEFLVLGAAGAVVMGIGIGINHMAGGVLFPHLESAMNRISKSDGPDPMEVIKTEPTNSIAFQKALDKVKQPMSARIAIHEGGLFGKGPGKSTQKYVVPIMFEDYMFSFIIEEYGLIGGIIVLILYISLLARSAIIVKFCDNHFAKTAVAGLSLLITGQALMHIIVNCDVGILTGQTLPMISHGDSSFLMFSLAFAIILSISKMAKRKMDRASENAEPLSARTGRSEVEDSLNDLDQLESGMGTDTVDVNDMQDRF